MSSRHMGLLGVVALLALGACASDLEDRVSQLQRENTDLLVQVEEQREYAAGAMSQLEESEAAAAQAAADAEAAKRLANDNARRAQEYAAALEEASRRMAKAETASIQVDDSAARLAAKQQELARRGYDVDVTPEGNLEITLSSDINFGSGKADLTKAGRQSLRGLAPALNGEYARYNLRVIGHTDNTPLVKTIKIFGSNRGLGHARALSVVRFLEQDAGIDPERMTSASEGEHDPIADNKTAAGRKRNRRVEIVVVMAKDAIAGQPMGK